MKALKKAIINTSSQASSESAYGGGKQKRARKKHNRKLKQWKRKSDRETRKAENETKRAQRRAGKGKTVKTNKQGEVKHGCNGSTCEPGKKADPGI